MAAHVSAGGTVGPAAAALALVVSTVLGPVLLDRRVDPARTLALALVAQVVWHVAFMLTSPLGHHTELAAMAGHHVVAAAVATVVAVGAERTLADAVAWLVGVALPVVVRAVALPSPARPAPAYAALARVPADEPHDPARPLRAPPCGVRLG